MALTCCDAESEQHFIKTVLAFFAASDGIVLENLALRFMKGRCLPVSCTSPNGTRGVARA